MSEERLEDCQRTPFYAMHVAAGARMVPFGGWAMPVQYKDGIIKEHERVRTGVGLFDVSHMGEFLVEGDGAEAFLQRITSNDVTTLRIGQAQYTTLLLESGGIVDDWLIYKRGEGRYLVCVNASRIDADWAHVVAQHSPADRCTLENASAEYAQLAIQGRAAASVLGPLCDVALDPIAYYRFAEGRFCGMEAIVARTGYTGEDGFEVFFPKDGAALAWERLAEAGAPHGLAPIGLGARDTLRLEMKYCLYGNDIDTTTTPLEARLGWVTKLDKGPFTGRDRLVAQKAAGVPRALIGFELRAPGIARHGYPVWVEGQSFGVVCSGAHTPSLGRAIGLCYLPQAVSHAGYRFEVEIRGKRLPAEVVKTPFYQRPY